MALAATYIVRVTSSIFQLLGLFLTAWRVYIRLKIGRFWWEDAFAAALLFTGLLWLISEWIYLLTDGLTSIINTWIYTICFTCLATLARMSVLFSIIRIIYGSPRLLRFTQACVAFYVACWATLIVLKVQQCASDPSWHHQIIPGGKPYCVVKLPIIIFEFATDCIAVLILVILPLRMLWRIKLPPRQRRMILCLFASSIFLAFAALFHAVGQFLNITIVMIAGINVEVAVSLFVCNLLVVVTYTFRVLLRDGYEKESSPTADDLTSNDDDFTTRITRPLETASLPLTTINLDISTSFRTTQRMESGVLGPCTLTEGLGDMSV